MRVVLHLALGLFLLMASLGTASAHALEPGYLDLRQLTPESWQVFWRKPDVNGAPMAIDATLPETCTPATGGEAKSDGYAWITAWVANCPDGIGGGEVRIPGLQLQRTDVLLRLQPLEMPATTARLTPNAPAYTVPETLSGGAVFLSYLGLGFEHILEGWDHLLFVFALLVLIRDPWRLVGAITAFTLAHSITLALAALGHVSVPGPPVEACIALSIVFLAVEILKHEDGAARLSERAPWIVSFSFGLLHGLGFAGALIEIGLPTGDIPIALLAFNVGVELGQLAFVGGVMACFVLLRAVWPGLVRAFRKAHSTGISVLGYSIGGVATFWLVERVAGF
ncbi:HupE/UreJ family protein [Aliiruegeria sabulilitoris]|uniref:HupE/UreJ family protein n=1 Tax=Aliiruegeria sabulilitoris TaxID=1510458 RepID=UPI00082A5A3A|nr:HupE/UreJ family protein [Aliiruegeria sabulilitoris]NDR55409.1 HupE/UreJ family protein [Pseudoruegeria sp. M32A2M]